jgi:hypothetical protein
MLLKFQITEKKRKDLQFVSSHDDGDRFPGKDRAAEWIGK